VQRSISYFRGIVDAVGEPLVVLDRGLCVRTANRAYYATFGLAPEQAEGRHLSELDGGAWRDAALAGVLERVIDTGEPAPEREVTRHVAGAGERTLLVEARRIEATEHEQALALLMLRDVTERRREERERAALAAELERSNAELERFAYVASHDLQEPLRMVTSYTQLLARRYADSLDDKAQRYIGFAVDGASRMQTLINDLLAYSRLGSRGGPVEAVDTGQVLVRALANLRAPIAASGAAVTHDPLPVVAGDATHLLQLVQNLVSNAVKFHGPQPPRVHVSARRGAGEHHWTFSVRDEGIGIDPAYFERVFVVFQRLHTRAEHPGTGIGLAICKRVVEAAGGRIWIESRPGEGSTFFFTLPPHPA
jgi:PAS domain S-box-containing protein